MNEFEAVGCIKFESSTSRGLSKSRRLNETHQGIPNSILLPFSLLIN